MEMKECLLTRRSIRKFTEQEVTEETLRQIVDAAAYAPSWKNTQISRYIAVVDPARKQELVTQSIQYPHNEEIISSAPVLIAQCFVKSRSGFNRDGTFATDRKDGWQYYDCGIAAQSFCLAAHDAGLATVIMGIFNREAVAQALGVPEDQELMALIALGYPAEAPAAPKRKDSEVLLTIC